MTDANAKKLALQMSPSDDNHLSGINIILGCAKLPLKHGRSPQMSFNWWQSFNTMFLGDLM